MLRAFADRVNSAFQAGALGGLEATLLAGNANYLAEELEA